MSEAFRDISPEAPELQPIISGLFAEYAARERSVQEARLNNLKNQLYILGQQIEQKEQETIELNAKIRTVGRSVDLARQELNISRPLAKEGIVPQVELIKLERQVNEMQGHAAGDALLCEVAKRLTQGLRARDLIARLSSDEFVLLLPECSSEQAVQRAHRVLNAIAQPLEILGQTHVPHASIGIAMFPNDGDTIDTLLRHADQAMHQAKSDHRHSLQLFSAEMNRRAQERASLERALQQALSDRSLMLHYQPQVLSSSPGTLHGVEALARWNHPQWGMVPPSQFIPVAEDAGLIHELTLWLLDEACRQLAAWRAAGRDVPYVAVNLSGRSFHRPEFVQEISDALQRHGVRASDVLLEITESVMMDARPVTLQNIEALHHQGFKLSLDDFGTGYSSLS